MAILFDAEKKIFKLDTASSSYVFAVHDSGRLLHLYYGAYLPDCDMRYLLDRGYFVSFTPDAAGYVGTEFSPDTQPSEYSCNGTGDFRISALQIRNADGNIATDIRYVSHRILSEKPALPGMPSLRDENGDSETLEVTTLDQTTNAEVKLYYTVYKDLPVMTRHAVVTNTSDRTMELERVFSACLDFNTMDYDMVHLYGKWAKERTVTERPLCHGIQSIQSKRGSSSHNHNPFVALKAHGTTEENGEVYGINLIYSGNFSIEAEVDCLNATRLLAGINPTDFTWRLEPNESFTAPEAVMVYTDKGLGEMSRIFHRTYMKHLIKSPWRDVERPVLINSWEAAYFDFDDDKLVADDGWFGHRESDDSSLGDWYVNEKKLKGGLSSLIERVNAEGLKFGIWYEPEMISPDSDLYRAHPDWCLHVPNRENSPARLQYVLDMTRKDVRDNIFAQMYKVLSENKIDYVKWDFNRNLTEVGSALLPPERQKEVMHRFVLGTYDLMDRFVKAFPNILFENCSGGGGRFDAGMLYYSPQIWCSDNTDAVNRLSIQYGSSFFYPISTVGSHVSVCPNHQTGRVTPFKTRGDVALAGSFGYEMDLNKISDEEKEMVKEQVAAMHEYYELTHEGLYYRLTGLKKQDFMAWEFVAKDQSRALLTIVKTDAEGNMLPVHTKVCGLAEDKLYRCSLDQEVRLGRTWNRAGLTLHQVLGEYESIRVEFTEVK